MDYQFQKFISLSQEKMNYDQVLEAVSDFVGEDPKQDYRIVIGTDSEGHGNVSYATALVVHRVGCGARGFICKNKVQTSRSIHQKIYTETTLSLAFAEILVPSITNLLGEKFAYNNLIIHVDVGQYGETKDMIREVAGMVRGSGFQVVTKPDSFAASNVADRFASPPAPPKHITA